MAGLLSNILITTTSQGKALVNKLTNELFAIYNTLNAISNSKYQFQKILFNESLKRQVNCFLETIDKIQDLLACTGSTVYGSNNLVLGNSDYLAGNNNALIGNGTIVSGSSNVQVGNDGMMVGNGNEAVGNNNYVFSSNQNVTSGNNLVVGNYSIDLNNINGTKNSSASPRK